MQGGHARTLTHNEKLGHRHALCARCNINYRYTPCISAGGVISRLNCAHRYTWVRTHSYTHSRLYSGRGCRPLGSDLADWSVTVDLWPLTLASSAVHLLTGLILHVSLSACFHSDCFIIYRSRSSLHLFVPPCANCIDINAHGKCLTHIYTYAYIHAYTAEDFECIYSASRQPSAN